MATATHTVHFARPSRTYDYLYDPNFVVSSNRDHAKESFKAQTGIERICGNMGTISLVPRRGSGNETKRYVPHFKTMFSCLRHHPRQAVTLDMTDPVPSHVSRQWRGYGEHARETLIRYKRFNYDPSVSVPPRQYQDAEVDGRNRYRFFRRPIIPFLPQMPPSVVLAPTKVDPLAPPSTEAEKEGALSGPQTRNVMVQTDYRESETQTDPYTPEYVVRPGSQPEVLTLATLSYGQGLPAGLAEVEMIERARAKREWEAQLPPLSDASQLEERRRMMKEQESKEWAFREGEIKKLQQERLAIIKRLLAQRETDHQALNDRRLEHLWSKKQAEKDRRVRRLRTDHVKALRKLTEKTCNVEGKLEHRNIIQEYTNFNSQVYAPMPRVGVYLDSGSEQYSVKSRFTSTLDGLLELEATLPDHVTQPRVKAPNQSAKAVGVKARQRAKLGETLEQVHSNIITERTRGHKPPKPLRYLERVEKPFSRPPTPCVTSPSEAEEEKELAVVLLQRVVRGRAIQNKMFEGKERRRELIAELRTTHALQSPERREKTLESEALSSKQASAQREEHKDHVVEEGVVGGAAGLLGRQLDTLTKELKRLQCERRVHAMVMLAEHQRRQREAEESGRRQREERLRRTEDEIFKQMVRVHHGTVDAYLEDIILQSVEHTADQQARQEVRRQADLINELAHQAQHTELSGRELVAEMVFSFLLPEVEKQTLRQQVHHSQHRHLLAAHRIIHQQTEAVVGEEEEERKGDAREPHTEES